MDELKALLMQAGFGEVSEAGHLPGGMRGVHYTSPPRRIRHPLPEGPAGGSQGAHRAPTRPTRSSTRPSAICTPPPRPPRTVCVEANRFAAAVLLQPDAFSLFARASGYDVLALQKRYGCSYASATLRLAEVMRRQPLMAVLYEREEKGEIAGWDSQPPPSRFMASVVVRTPGFGMRDSHLLCGERGGRPRKTKSVSHGSLAHRVLLTGGAAYAEREPGRNGNGAGPSDLAVVARPVPLVRTAGQDRPGRRPLPRPRRPLAPAGPRLRRVRGGPNGGARGPLTRGRRWAMIRVRLGATREGKRETMPAKHRNTDTITFSLPPEMAQHLRQVVKEEDRTVSELLREAIRLYVEEREWRRRERLERLRSRQSEQEETRRTDR